MNRIISCPAPNRLKQILQEELDETEERELSQHLARCTSCQHALDRFLIGDGFGADRLRRFSPDRATADSALDEAMAELKATGIDEADEMDHSDPQVSLDFLQPLQRPGTLGQLGHYEILNVVGRGGMGVVLKAFDTSLRRVVAIKVLARNLADEPAAGKRFVREAQAAAAVSHDHIVTIHAVEADNDPPFIVMHFVDGKSLQQRIDQTGPMEPKEILRIGMQAAAGLAAAHAQGLVHRDIKPANILLENGLERVKITDFGLARAVDDASTTESGIVAGTPQFMAPEQAAGDAIDHRADLFSLGSVMYAMCTGLPPFRASTTMGVLKRVYEKTPRPIRELNPDIPEWLVQIIDKLHAKNPAERFQSAAEVADLLGRRLAELQHTRPLGCGGSPLSAAAADSHSRSQPIAVSAEPHADGEQPKAGSSSRTPKATWPVQLGLVATVLLAISGGLVVTEATGVTTLVQSVIRITRGDGDGTLLIVVDDPGIKVTIDGQEIVVMGAGSQEIRLKTGSHRLLATKDGEPIRDEPITITRGGRQVVRIRHEEEQFKFDSSELVKLRSPRLALVKEVFVKDGDFIKQGQPMATIVPIGPPPSGAILGEDIEIRAPCDAKVVEVYDRVGDSIDQGHVIAKLQPGESAPRLESSTAHGDDTRQPTTRKFHIRLRAQPDGSLAALTLGERRLKHIGELVGELARAKLESGRQTEIEVIITADANLKPDLVQSVKNAVGRAGFTKVTVETIRDDATADRAAERTPTNPSAELTAEQRDAITRIQAWGKVQVDPTKPVNSIGSLAEVHGTARDDWDLEPLKSFPFLRVLELSMGRAPTDRGMKHLSSLTEIEELYLAGTPVTDAGLQYVRGMTKLRKLSIGNTQVTDRGLDHLRALKSLEELALGYTRVTDVGIKALKAALPTLQVIQQSRTEALDLEKERYSREPLRIRIRASAAGELADDGIEVGDRTFRDIGALHGMIHRVARKVGESLEVILEADPSLNFTVLQKLQDAIARAGVKKVRVSSSTGDSAVNMEAVKWNTTGFEATYNILDQSFDAASQRMTWTLETKPRAYAWYGYHAVLYNSRGQRVLEDAPFFWSTGRSSGRNVEIASLDLRWIARRLRGTANIAVVAEIAVESYPNRPLGGAKSSDSQAPTQIVTGQLPDAATWDHKSLEGLYSISEVAYDETNQTITWVLETKQRFYAAQIYHVVFHDKSGVPLHPDAPLIWSTGQRDNRPVEIATLDLGYIVELLGARASDVAVVSVERYRDQ